MGAATIRPAIRWSRRRSSPWIRAHWSSRAPFRKRPFARSTWWCWTPTPPPR